MLARISADGDILRYSLLLKSSIVIIALVPTVIVIPPVLRVAIWPGRFRGHFKLTHTAMPLANDDMGLLAATFGTLAMWRMAAKLETMRTPIISAREFHASVVIVLRMKQTKAQQRPQKQERIGGKEKL